MHDGLGRPQTAVVLGGTSEIAEAILLEFSASLVTVALAGRDANGLAAAARRIIRSGVSQCPTVLFDALNVNGAGNTVAAAFAAVNEPVDLVIVAVGSLGNQTDDEDDARGSARAALVNFAWPTAALAAVRQRMVAQGAGRIVVLSTVAGVRVRRANYVYGGAKAGLDRLSQGLADSLWDTGVGVLIVRPGFVVTKMTASRRRPPLASTAPSVARATVRALARGRRTVTVPPAMNVLLVVARLLPPPWWRRLAPNE